MRPLYAGWGRLMQAFVRWLCAGIAPPPPLPSGEAVPENGAHVYVTRGDSTFLALAFLESLFRQNVRDVYFLGGIRLWWYRPWRPIWRAVRGTLAPSRRPVAEPGTVAEVLESIHARYGRRGYELASHVAAGRSVAVVLPVARGRGLLADWTDYVQMLLTLQASLSHPIVLWPHILATREQSGRSGRGVLDWLLGDHRRPGWLRHWTMLLVLRHGSVMRAEPVVLPAWRDDHASAEVASSARKLRGQLHQCMDEAQRVVAGPSLGNYEQMEREVLADAELRAGIAQLAQKTGQSELLLEAQAARKLRRMAANYDVRAIRAMEHVLYWLFHRIYDGIVIDEAGLAKVIEASRRAPVVFCPSHKSHIDYLVLSFIMWTHGIAPPHVAAGANLDFFPVGTLFRRCGAFFLRRSFRDDPAYGALMRAYLAFLVRAGTSIEFFLEGTRSRSGKLLPPKFGLLRMLLDAYCHGARDDIVFVPVSIDYERILEAQSFRRELRGASKQAETFRGLLASTGLLGSRYGRLHVQFGEPMSLATWALGRPLQAEVERREQVEKLGYEILHRVGTICSVTPTNVVATVLLGHVGRGIAQGTLIARGLAILEFLESVSARLVESLVRPQTRIEAILEATQKLVDERVVVFEFAGQSDQERIYSVVDEARATLDYHKNAIMNHFGAAAIVCRALLVAGRSEVATHAETMKHAQFLSHLFKREFIYRVDREFSVHFDETVGELSLFDLIEVGADGQLRVREEQTVAHLSGLLTNYIEGYRIAIEAALDLRAMELTPHDFVARALERARRAYLEGASSRPEAASRTLMETALSWLLGQGLLVCRAHEKPSILRFGAAGHLRLTQVMQQLEPFARPLL